MLETITLKWAEFITFRNVVRIIRSEASRFSFATNFSLQSMAAICSSELKVAVYCSKVFSYLTFLTACTHRVTALGGFL